MENWLKEIKNHRKKIYSQCGEEGFIEFILKSIDPILAEAPFIVEYGAGDGITLSNSYYFFKDRLSVGKFYDGDPKGAAHVDKAWIDVPFAIKEAKEFNDEKIQHNLFLIDLDGNDWYILNAFIGTLEQELRPELIVCEINPIWERDEACVIAYNPNHVWKNNTYYGMSLKAAEIMMQKHGYTLIFVNDSLNAYFLKNELLPGKPDPVEYRVKRDHPKGSGQWMQVNDDLTLKPL